MICNDMFLWDFSLRQSFFSCQVKKSAAAKAVQLPLHHTVLFPDYPRTVLTFSALLLHPLSIGVRLSHHLPNLPKVRNKTGPNIGNRTVPNSQRILSTSRRFLLVKIKKNEMRKNNRLMPANTCQKTITIGGMSRCILSNENSPSLRYYYF